MTGCGVGARVGRMARIGDSLYIYFLTTRGGGEGPDKEDGSILSTKRMGMSPSSFQVRSFSMMGFHMCCESPANVDAGFEM